MAWSLWASDFFDRESPPSCDARGEALAARLAADPREVTAKALLALVDAAVDPAALLAAL